MVKSRYNIIIEILIYLYIWFGLQGLHTKRQAGKQEKRTEQNRKEKRNKNWKKRENNAEK